MSGTVAFIRKLLDAGMPLEMALTAAEAFEHEVSAKLELRKAKDRDRKRAPRNPRNSTESAERQDSMESAESTESTPPAPDKETPPTPPKEINPTPVRCAAPRGDVREAEPVEDDWPEAEGDGKRATTGWAKRLAEMAGPGLADPNKHGSLLLTSAEIGRWRQAGCSWEDDVVPVIRARTMQPRPDPITAWSFFTQAVIAQASRRKAALVIPLHPEGSASVRKPSRPGSDRQAQFVERLSRIDAAMAAAVEQSSG